MISTTVSTVSEYKSEKAFEKLNESGANSYARVVRDGEIKKIDISDLVVGDIVYIGYGEKISADGEIISGRINVDQSALNGESVDVKKIPGNNNDWRDID